MLISKRKNNDYFNADAASIELLRRGGLNPELLELLNINNIEIEKEKCKSNKKFVCASSIQPVNRAELSQRRLRRFVVSNLSFNFILETFRREKIKEY